MKQSLSKDEIKAAFKRLLNTRLQNKDRIATKEELAQVEENKKLVEEAAKHTPQNIIETQGALRLQFGETVSSLKDTLTSELGKLSNLQSAIKVQNDNLKRSTDTKVAANALYILKLEQEQKEAKLDEEHAEDIKNLNESIEEARKEWEEEQADFEAEQKERREGLEKTRTTEMEEYKYRLDRKYQIEEDQYEERKKMLLRQLDEELGNKEKNWADREKELEQRAEEFNKQKNRVDNFDAELKEKVEKAREKTMKETSRDCSEEMQQYEQEISASTKRSQARIDNLRRIIEEQKSSIQAAEGELKEVSSELRTLSKEGIAG
ncbi:MAG: hypothetical protein MK212_13710 [Saprospiraceae bacterium]|nr:hypothetical protein [Saprospiraceae bacterium]